MDPEVKTQEQKKDKTKPLLIIVILLLVVCVAGMGIFILTRQSTTVDEPVANTGKPVLEYASKGVTAIDQESIQSAYDEAFKVTEDSVVALYYQNGGLSEDGKNFSCYIGNSPYNQYDTYFALCDDPEFKNVIFLSGLLRPGEVLQEVTLDKSLDKGTHTVYCVQTMVNAEQSITNQVSFTLSFVVN